jgi:DNA polymerase II large subunit
MSDGINDAEGRQSYYESPMLTKEARKIRARLNMQMNKLLKMERKFAKQAELAARPYRQKASKIHRAWVKLYKHYTHVQFYTAAQIRRIR